MKIGEKIRKIRKDFKETQAEFAQKIGVSTSALSGYEISHNNPSIKILLNISDVYGVSLDYLLKEKECKFEFNKSITDKHLLYLVEQADQLPKQRLDRIKVILETLLKE